MENRFIRGQFPLINPPRLGTDWFSFPTKPVGILFPSHVICDCKHRWSFFLFLSDYKRQVLLSICFFVLLRLWKGANMEELGIWVPNLKSPSLRETGHLEIWNINNKLEDRFSKWPSQLQTLAKLDKTQNVWWAHHTIYLWNAGILGHLQIYPLLRFPNF